MPPLLQVKDLSVERRDRFGGTRIVLRKVSLVLEAGEILAVAGEDGSGRSALARTILRAPGPHTRVLNGRVELEGTDLLSLSRRKMRGIRREGIAWIEGDTRAQMNPHATVEEHLWDTLSLARRRKELGGLDDWSPLFYEVGLFEPERVLSTRGADLAPLTMQRVMLLSALFSGAPLLVCHDPAARLDPVAAGQFHEILHQIVKERRLAVLLTTGRLAGLDRVAHRVCVLFQGGVLETGPAEEILAHPRHAYTREFLASTPRPDRKQIRLPIVEDSSVQEAEQEVHRYAG